MTDRIKDLALDAIVKNIAVDAWVFTDHELETFAGSIIRECMYVVRDINQEYDGGSTVVNAADKIRTHFGIDF